MWKLKTSSSNVPTRKTTSTATSVTRTITLTSTKTKPTYVTANQQPQISSSATTSSKCTLQYHPSNQQVELEASQLPRLASRLLESRYDFAKTAQDLGSYADNTTTPHDPKKRLVDRLAINNNDSMPIAPFSFNYNKAPSRSSSLDCEIGPYLSHPLDGHFLASIYLKQSNATTIVERNQPLRFHMDTEANGGFIFAQLKCHKNHRKEIISALHNGSQRSPVKVTSTKQNGVILKGQPVFCEARDILFFGEYIYLDDIKDVEITFLVNSDDIFMNGIVKDANLSTLNIFPIYLETPNEWNIFYVPTDAINNRFERNIKIVQSLPSQVQPIPDLTPATLPREIPSTLKCRLVKKFIGEIESVPDYELLILDSKEPLLNHNYNAIL